VAEPQEEVPGGGVPEQCSTHKLQQVHCPRMACADGNLVKVK